MNTNLLNKATSRRETAETILKETNSIQLFSKIGKVEIIGSMRLDLMYRNDIDLLVISDDIQHSKAVEVTKSLMDSKMFQTVALADYQTYPAYDMPLGYYWELIVEKDNEKWKFDVWYLKPYEKYTHMVFNAIESFEKILKEHPEKREIILKIKEAYFDGVKYKEKVKSIDIYKAVLENSINTIEEFDSHILAGRSKQL